MVNLLLIEPSSNAAAGFSGDSDPLAGPGDMVVTGTVESVTGTVDSGLSRWRHWQSESLKLCAI
jgi:hypothetical protein